MDFNLPLNIVYDKTLNNCPECGSNDILIIMSHTYSIPIKPKKPVEKCRWCGFKSEYRFELLNKINRRAEKIDKILDK